MSNNLTDSNILDIYEKVNFLYKNFQGVANTREDLEWFLERNVKYNDYVKAEDIFLEKIPKDPIFNQVITPEEDNLTEEDFATTTNGWGILEDSTKTIRKYCGLILQSIPNTNETSYYKLDVFNNNILKDSIAFNTHMELNSLPKYPQTLTNQNAILANSNNPENILDGVMGGNKIFDPKSGILHFPDYKLNICNGSDNRPVFTFYKYVGKKGLQNIDQILLTNKDTCFNSVDISGTLNSMLVFDVSNKRINPASPYNNGIINLGYKESSDDRAIFKDIHTKNLICNTTQINSDIRFYVNNETLRLDTSEDGTGGTFEIKTREDGEGGSLTEKLRVNNIGAIGIGGANYGISGQVLTSNGSTSAVSWSTISNLGGGGNVSLTNYSDSSFGNVDISGNINMNYNNINDIKHQQFRKRTKQELSQDFYILQDISNIYITGLDDTLLSTSSYFTTTGLMTDQDTNKLYQGIEFISDLSNGKMSEINYDICNNRFNFEESNDGGNSYKLSNICASHAYLNNLSVSGDILLNGDLSINTINYKNINGIRKDYRQHFTIYVSGGNSQTPYYTFTPDITKNYKFVKGNKYTFIGNNISSQHPFSVELINSGDGKLIFEKDGILKETKYDYDFSIINNQSFYIIIPEDLEDNEFQYYCVNHPTSMRKNLKLDRKNIFYKDIFTNSSFTTKTSNIQNLENDIYENILPKNKSTKIKIKIELDYFVCVGRNERINIELWRNNTIINSSNNLGLIFAAGGYINNFSKEIIDSFDFGNNTNTEIKYYIKYKLENNDSKSEMGIVNVSTDSFIGNSLFLLEEL